MTLSVVVNGRPWPLDGVPPRTTLLRFLRERGLTGAKEGCAEGDCGACTVAVVERGAGGDATYRAINSCIALAVACAGREIVTVEGLAEGGALHPAQATLAEGYGSQCGFCTPGVVMSMFEGCHRRDMDAAAMVEQLSGNLCRCTGYRPIRDAMAKTRGAERDDALRRRLARPAPSLAAVDHAAGGERFVRPDTLAELLGLRAAHPDAVLVAGATEIGVELNKKGRRFPLLLSTEGVLELRGVGRGGDGWRIGGAATLTEVDEALAGELPMVEKMLRAFASRQIRSRATVAGNLVTASPIGDMAPVLLALDAEVTLASARGARRLPLSDFFTGYRATALAADEVMTEVFVPHAPAGVRRLAASYKVSKRRELDISIVAAGFCVDLDGDVVVRARLAYGGVAPTPVRARKTEARLEGRAWDEAALSAALASLEAETSPIDDARASAAYRRALAGSLFEKFFRGETSEAQDGAWGFVPSGGVGGGADPSRALPHESGEAHVTGRALYVDDEAQRRGGMLEAWPVVSPHARARIVRRDAARARAMGGVRAVLFAEDVPGDNDVGAIRHDEPLFARGEACFAGHLVAVVVAETRERAREAAAAVEVDYEPLPAILTIEDAVARDSFHTNESRIARGDVAAALAAAPRTLSGVLRTGAQEHLYLETHAAWAEPGDDGSVFVAASTQHPSEVQAVVAHVLGVPRNRVVVESPRMGGGFGGKETQGNAWAAVAALAAVHTKQPVRVALDRDVDMTVTGKRHPFRFAWRAGFDDEGRLLALDCDAVSDGGWALDLSESILDRALFHVDNAYFVPALDVRGRVAKTNVVSHTAFRGFGGPQGVVLIEEVMDRVARTLGLPPELVRERNLYRAEGGADTTHYGQAAPGERLRTIWRDLAASASIRERRAEIDAFNARHRFVKRGLAMTPVKFGISFTATFLNQAGALVLAYRDGTVQVNHGGTEMGQGLYTKIRGIAMRELGLSAEAVRVMRTRTDKVPNTSPTAASSGSDLNGAAVKDACEALRARLAPVAAAMLGAPVAAVRLEGGRAVAEGASVAFAEVCERAYVEQVPLSATGFYRTPGLSWDKRTGKGRPFHYFACGAAVSEVEVDGLSGMKRVRRVDILHDVGDSLNPGVDRGQIEGGFVQGMGWLTGEEIVWSAEGRLLTHSASTYAVPSCGDAPPDFRVGLLPRAAQPGVVHGSKAVGEPPLMLAVSVREAIRDAIGAFGAPGGAVDLPCPATHEAIFFAIRRRGRP